jgi:acetyl-CoA synthetase
MQDINLLEHQPIAWTPTPDVIERAQLTKFMRQVGVSTWDELYQLSIRDVEKFTEEVLKFLDIKFDPPYEKLLDTSDGIEFPKWLTGAGLNITTMCLDRWQTDEMKDQPAIVFESEVRPRGFKESFVYTFTRSGQHTYTLSYNDLFNEVWRYAVAFRHYGFGKGDAIGIHMPMTPTTVIILLAIARIGAIAVPVFSGYGVEAVVSRLNAVNAKALCTVLKFPRRGKWVDAFDVAVKAAAKVPSLERIFWEAYEGDFAGYERYLGLDERFILNVTGECEDEGLYRGEVNEIEPTSAEDPLIILYTSGTTGKPKGIAHTHASFPIKAAQDMAFGMDVGKGTRICWYTDLGWMMGPWLIYGALINGATICLYDGAPDYPTPDRMWEFCARHKVEFLGISPTLVRSLAAHEAEPPALAGGEASTTSQLEDSPPAHAGGSAFPPHQRHDLSSLRAFGSTGEPWNPGPWWWLFREVGNSKLPIINYSGGTEISGGILCGNFLLPQKPCSFPAPCPGMDVDIVDENGESVGPNQVGELVIRQPWIGMARGFWQEKERYLETYWRRFKNIWVHGDWAMRDEDGHWFILGRSDDTLKVAGKRVGPAEVESILVSHPDVTEAAVIGVPDETKGTAMVAFVVLNDEYRISNIGSKDDQNSTFDIRNSKLASELRELVARDMGKPLAPSKIHFVSALPKTRNAKVMRRVLRAAYLDEDAGDLSSLENPQAVDEIRKLTS